jgi:ABC-2 type transport system ATP-binding protein
VGSDDRQPDLTGQLALDVSDLEFRYDGRQALRGVSFDVVPAEIFALLGPNGGGKTTLFRIVATLAPPGRGRVRVFGQDVVARPDVVRRWLGVVFQSPALDPRLTVAENLRHQGHLYGLRGDVLDARIADALARVGVSDRRDDLVLTLSGGLQRRAELAKALVHQPPLLLLDEPTTGLDPGARRDVWDHLRGRRDRDGVTVVLTTHLMDEAARSDRVGIIHEGRMVAVGRPDELTAAIGGDVLQVATADPGGLAARIRARFGVTANVIDDRIRIECDRGHEFITDLVEAFPGEIDAVTFGRPTLEDVFMQHTGRRLTS